MKTLGTVLGLLILVNIILSAINGNYHAVGGWGLAFFEWIWIICKAYESNNDT